MSQPMSGHQTDRRQFLRGMAGSAVAAALLSGCAALDANRIVDAPAPNAAQFRESAKVAFVKTDDRVHGLHQALDLLGVNPVEGKRVLVKPNFNSADPPPGSTDPQLMAATIERLQGMGADTITVTDRSGMGDTRAVMQQLGIFDMGEKMGFETLVLDELDADGWHVIDDLPDMHWSRGFPLAGCCQDAEAIVQLCCLKTHRFGGHFTMSLKNSVGLVAKFLPGDAYNYMGELHNSPDQRRMIAEVNAAYRTDLVVMDGVEAFVNGGPDRGTLATPSVMLASADRVALDAVGVAILRHLGTTSQVSQGPIFELEQIARAVELGVGVGSPAQIEIVTGDDASSTYAAEIWEHLTA